MFTVCRNYSAPSQEALDLLSKPEGIAEILTKAHGADAALVAGHFLKSAIDNDARVMKGFWVEVIKHLTLPRC